MLTKEEVFDKLIEVEPSLIKDHLYQYTTTPYSISFYEKVSDIPEINNYNSPVWVEPIYSYYSEDPVEYTIYCFRNPPFTIREAWRKVCINLYN